MRQFILALGFALMAGAGLLAVAAAAYAGIFQRVTPAVASKIIGNG